MITLKELLEDSDMALIAEQSNKDFSLLFYRINKIRELYGLPMIVTNCIRTWERHLRIYADKGITDKNKIPLRSKHLFAQAVDILDRDGGLYRWCIANEEELKVIGVWLEKNTKGWVHFQIVPYGSYKEGKSIFFNA